MAIQSQGHQEARMLYAELALLLLIVDYPRRVNILSTRVNAQTRGNAVVEQWPQVHVGWYVDVRQLYCSPSWRCFA